MECRMLFDADTLVAVQMWCRGASYMMRASRWQSGRIRESTVLLSLLRVFLITGARKNAGNAEERCTRPKQSASVCVIGVFPRPIISGYGAIGSYTTTPTRGNDMSRVEVTLYLKA